MEDAGNPKPVLCDNLERWDGGKVGSGFKREGTYVYLMLIHVDAWQKPSQDCKNNYPLIKKKQNIKTEK